MIIEKALKNDPDAHSKVLKEEDKNKIQQANLENKLMNKKIKNSTGVLVVGLLVVFTIGIVCAGWALKNRSIYDYGITIESRVSANELFLAGHANTFLSWMQYISEYCGVFYWWRLLKNGADECTVPNPFYYYTRFYYSCTSCENITSALTPKVGIEAQPVSVNIVLGTQPIICKKWGRNVSLEEMSDVISHNLHIFKSSIYTMSCSANYITRVEDITDEKIMSRVQEDTHIHLSWTTDSYMLSYVMRQLFPRPALIPKSVNIGLKKILLIDGKNAPSYPLPVYKQNSIWYEQGAGSRKIVITPRKGCMHICTTLTVILKPSDVIVINVEVWDVLSLPHGNLTSLAFIGHFDDSLS
ncbi:uncharacterized protein LOC131945027 [Physella acuta]|uniref:uncharacterized protein LOC131945027 n=1 Tax=Physella acuta TaxID=109671 RepID=UPI0027DB26E8|nr:uncharacterized protein LOC131945027 [Physella acuta]